MIDGWNKGGRRALRIAAELAVAFGGLALLDQIVTGGTGFALVQPNPLWLPVVVMALAYGTGPALVAATIASATWLVHAHHIAGERDYLDHLFHLSLPPLLWFVAAVGIGEVTMLRTQRHARLERRAGTARRNVERLTDAFHRLAHTNRSLQVQVATDERTIGHVIATASRLAATDPADRREALAHLIALAARTQDFTCYRFTGHDARAWLRGPAAAGRADALPDALAMLALRRQGPIHVGRRGDRGALSGIGVVAVPLPHPDTGRIAGCVVLHTIPFTALNAHALAEMAEIGRWLSPLLAESQRVPARTIRPAGLVA